MIGDGHEVERPGELHELSARTLQRLASSEAIGVLGCRRRAEEDRIQALGRVHVEFAPVDVLQRVVGLRLEREHLGNFDSAVVLLGQVFGSGGRRDRLPQLIDRPHDHQTKDHDGQGDEGSKAQHNLLQH